MSRERGARGDSLTGGIKSSPASGRAPVTRRWLAIAVAALAATLGGLVLSGCGSSSPKPARNSAPKGRVSSCEGDDCFDTRISGQLKVGEGIYLTLSALDTKNPNDNEAKECTNPRHGIPSDVDSRTN